MLGQSRPVKVEPPKHRATVLEEPGGLRIVIPVKRSWALVAFLSLWLCGWAVGEIAVPVAYARGGGSALFLVLWLSLWTVGGVYVMYVWLWIVAGQELVYVDGVSLVITHRTLVFSRSRAYDFSQVCDLRASPVGFDPWDSSSSLQWWGIGGGTAAFDYGAGTYRFGGRLSEAEAKRLVEAINRRFAVQGMLKAA